MTAFDFGLDTENSAMGQEAAPLVVALVDRRGRRMLVPVHNRLRRHVSSMPLVTPCNDANFTSGTIH